MFGKPLLLLAAGIATVCGAEAFSGEIAKDAPRSVLVQTINDLTETVQVMQKRIDNLENLATFGSAALIPNDTKLQAIRSGSATFLLGIDKPQAIKDGSEFTLTIVNPQSIGYTNISFDIRVFGKDAGGDPKAFKQAMPVARIVPSVDGGTRTQFKFAVPGMTPDNFAVAYVASMNYSSITAQQNQ